MGPILVKINHAGKIYEKVELDQEQPPSSFKQNIYQCTGVPVDRMKVITKAGILKDDTPWTKVAPKPDLTFTVVGTASEIPKPPEKPVVFLEDLDDSELAEVLAFPVGLRNLGNTCYMNASVQALRAIPELQIALNSKNLQSDSPLPNALCDLYASMSRTSGSVVPFTFLSTLRQVNPQFAERDRTENKVPGIYSGYAQQDAEECFRQIITNLSNIPGLSPDGPVSPELRRTQTSPKKFVEQYLSGNMRRELTCDDAPHEALSVIQQEFTKIECNITVTTNHMITGIMNSLDQKLEKRSPTLDRDAIYSQKERISRLPGYLVVHMVRLSWRQDIGKKAKIMRKVTFPLEFDALDLVTNDLKDKLIPVSNKLKKIVRDRAERREVRRKTKIATNPSKCSDEAISSAPPTALTTVDVEMSDTATVTPECCPEAIPEQQKEKGMNAAGSGELGDESDYRAKEKAELEALVDDEVKNDTGASTSGLYDLVSIVTHKGPAADAGHYIGFVKKSVFHPVEHSSSKATIVEDDEDWYKFDDDKVSIFPKDKLATLSGGGEDSSAYLLIYKSKSF